MSGPLGQGVLNRLVGGGSGKGFSLLFYRYETYNEKVNTSVVILLYSTTTDNVMVLPVPNEKSYKTLSPSETVRSRTRETVSRWTRIVSLLFFMTPTLRSVTTVRMKTVDGVSEQVNDVLPTPQSLLRELP